MQAIRSRELRERIVPYVLIAPVVIYYIFFWLYPVLGSVLNSFRSITGEYSLLNYRYIFTDPVFYRALLNTAFIVAVSVTLEFAMAFGIALLINTKFRGSGIFLFLAIIPMALPAVAVGAIWSSGFATYGWMNSLLMKIGFIEEAAKIPFLAATPFQSMLLIIVIDAWQVVPFMMIILLAGMQNLQEEMKEAGYVFGGTRLTVLRKITIPLLRPTITTAVILRIISAIQIWLIIVMLFGFQRLPVLLEELVYFVDVAQSEEFFRIGLAYSVLVAFIVSGVAVIYLKVSGAFSREAEE
ncbi:MAG: sugar ABC transporter permease [Spirochaetaceae bacterium]|nr:sugar ABC transporter permease [Spirochaetaceae bacterium]